MSEIVGSPTLMSLWACVVVAMAASSISITVTQTELFAPLRALANRTHAMVGHLFHCFYCMSHWVVILGILIYRPVILPSGFVVIDWLVSAFFTITLATFTSGLVFKVFLAAMSKALKERELKQLPAVK